MAAVTPPAASSSPTVGGAAPHSKPHRPGNLTLSQRGRIWIGVLFWLGIVWGAFVWVCHDLYISGGRP